MSASPRISIVIPVYNEEAILRTAVAALVDGLREIPHTYEIILAENGSKDRTVEIAKELSARFPGVTTFSASEPNYGKALKQGILLSRGDIVICDEIDLCDVDFHRRAVEILESGQADLVIGSKLAAGAEDDRPAIRHAASIAYSSMLKILLGFRGTDTHGLKAFRRVALLARGIFEPGENDLLAGLGGNRLAKVGDLSFGHVAFPVFDVPGDAHVAQDGRKILGRLAVRVLVAFGHGHDESFEIGHAASPSGWGWWSRNVESWASSARANAGRASPRLR